MDGDAPIGSHNAQDDHFKIKGAALARTTSNQTHGEETCTICLEPISERAVATPCNHLTFDFLCLVSWLQERPNCPLCKADVKEVQYDWRSEHDYKTYHVPKAVVRASTEQRRMGRRTATRRTVHQPVVSEDPALDRRRHVYRHRLLSLHVGSNRVSQYQEFGPTDVARSPELQSKARTFLRRELQVFPFLENREFLMEYIVAVLKKYDAKAADGKAEELLKEFVGDANATGLLHELQAWLRSPFTTLRAWDDEVRYLHDGAETGKRQK